MKSFQAPAIRICGAATIVVVLISFVQIAGLAFELHTLPSLSMSMGLAVLVAFAAFLVANAPHFAMAESICKCSAVVIAVLSVLRVYESGVASLGPFDLALALFLYVLLAELCRRVLARRAAAGIPRTAG